VVPFKSTDVGAKATSDFLLSNAASSSVTVNSVTVSGQAFALTHGLTLPVQIGPDNRFRSRFRSRHKRERYTKARSRWTAARSA